MRDAACKEMDPNLFITDNPSTEARAKRVCGGCDVAKECLDYSIRNKQWDGVFGGMNGGERKRLARRGAR